MADIKQITLPDGNTYNFKDDSKTVNVYCTCDTAAGTAAKVATVVKGTFTLETGAMVRVKFTNANTYNGTTTLNVGSTGAKNITRVDTTATTRYYWSAGEVVDFVYDGTNYVMSRTGTATTTYYGLTKLTTSGSSTSTTTALTPASLNSVMQYLATGLAVYSASATYAVGDRVRYGNYMYECNTAITTAEAWTAAHWTALDPLLDQIEDKSSVSINRKTISGTNIADITIDGTTTQLYAPTGGGSGGDVNVIETVKVNGTALTPDANKAVDVIVPTKTSDVQNDSNFVSDASYMHTDNNFTTTLKNKLDGIATGAEVNVQSDWNETDSTSDAYIINKPDVVEIEGIASGVIGKEDTYNTRFVNWEESSGDIINLSISADGKTLNINKYDQANDSWTTTGEIDISKDYLPLGGGTMTGDITMDSNADIYLGSSGSTIEQKLADSANYGAAFRWDKETPYTESYKPQIGFYNAGNAITILPHETSSTPWSGAVGLYLKYETNPYMKYENQYVGRYTATPTNGRIIVSDGTTGGMQTSGYSFTESTSSVSLSFGGGTATMTARKKGNVVYFNPSIGNTSKFASASSGDSLGTLPSGYRPSVELYIPIAMRTSGTWASATYYPCYLRIQTNGTMSIYGNTTNIRACTNIAGSVCFPV